MDPPAEAAVLLLDVEGTTTPISFVYDVLFPYAREHLYDFLARHLTSGELESELKHLREENAADIAAGFDPPPLVESSPQAQLESFTAYSKWLMDRDRKSTGLKALQGRIWHEGYGTGELHSQVFADVPPAFTRWRAQGRTVAIFSSGSVLAQRLLFAHTAAGDLTPYIGAYFDTTSGRKNDPQSYRKIARELQHRPKRILFISDSVPELDAAASIGMDTRFSVRPGNRWPSTRLQHASINDFEEIYP